MSDVADLVNALRARGVTVYEWSGWNGRGNEGKPQIDIRGAIIHHTGSNYGSAYAGLVSSTQDWAYGQALANFAGNADGSLTVLASGVAWHAGGGFGPNQGPLSPYASNRNYYTVGLEIVYPGVSPMTAAQYSTAKVFAKTVADLFANGDINVVRGHGEVNGRGYEGKWDPGFRSGQMIDMNAFRAEARNATSGGPFMALTDTQQQYIYDSLVDLRNDLTIPFLANGVSTGNVIKYLYEAVVDIRTDLSLPYLTNGKSTGQVITELEARLTKLEDLIKGVSAGVVDVDKLADALVDKVDVDLVKK